MVILYDWPTKVTYIPTPLQLVATTPLHWLCICQNTHLFAKRESRVNTVQNSAALEKDPLKIYAIMCNMRRLNSHRELGKFLHTAAAAAAACAPPPPPNCAAPRYPFRAKAISYILPPPLEAYYCATVFISKVMAAAAQTWAKIRVCERWMSCE